MLILLLFSATIVYVIIYAVVMPVRVIEEPLYFDYGPHSQVDSPYVQDRVQLPHARANFLTERIQWDCINTTCTENVEKERILFPDLAYDIMVHLELADTGINEQIGMFMINSTLYSDSNRKLAKSARPLMLKQSNGLCRAIETLVWSLPVVLGFKNVAQTMTVTAFNAFKEVKEMPLGQAEIVLNHPQIQVYSAKVIIIVQLTGLRYLMYHWFVPVTVLAILNIAFLEGFCILIWYTTKTLVDDDDGDDDSLLERRIEDEEDTVKPPRSLYSPSIQSGFMEESKEPEPRQTLRLRRHS